VCGGADSEGAAPTLVCLVELRVAASYGLEVAALKPIASIAALGLLVAACSASNNAPLLPQPAQLSMAASAWVFQYSNSMPASPAAAGSGWSFTFANTSGPSGGVHYLVTQSPNLASKSALTMSGVISVAPGTVWGSNDPSDMTPDHCRAYFQQAGDDLSGTGPYEFYRWFSHTTIALTDGSFNVTIPFDPSQWGSVLGKDGNAAGSGWTNARANAQWIGITCGGSYFAGHGAYVKSGSATFQMNSFSVQ
jgi:hypothetical protein